MKAFIVKASEYDYDEYDAVVIIAESEERALEIAFRGGDLEGSEYWGWSFKKSQYPITAVEIDMSKEQMVLASFNAG